MVAYTRSFLRGMTTHTQPFLQSMHINGALPVNHCAHLPSFHERPAYPPHLLVHNVFVKHTPPFGLTEDQSHRPPTDATQHTPLLPFITQSTLSCTLCPWNTRILTSLRLETYNTLSHQTPYTAWASTYHRRVLISSLPLHNPLSS